MEDSYFSSCQICTADYAASQIRQNRSQRELGEFKLCKSIYLEKKKSGFRSEIDSSKLDL
jgi:hypothetical protein